MELVVALLMHWGKFINLNFIDQHAGCKTTFQITQARCLIYVLTKIHSL